MRTFVVEIFPEGECRKEGEKIIYKLNHIQLNKVTMKRILFSLLMALLAAPTFAQVDKDHDFKAAKNMEIFNAIY